MRTNPSNDPLTRLLARQEVVILDGGMGTELEHRGPADIQRLRQALGPAAEPRRTPS